MYCDMQAESKKRPSFGDVNSEWFTNTICSANERSKGEGKGKEEEGKGRGGKGEREREIGSEALAETEKFANAPAGNRTRDPSKRGWCSTIEPPRQAISPASLFSNKLAGDIACLGGSMVEHQPRLLGSRVRFPAGAFAIFSVSAKASLPISLSLSPFPPLPFPSSSFPFPSPFDLSFALKNASSHLFHKHNLSSRLCHPGGAP